MRGRSLLTVGVHYISRGSLHWHGLTGLDGWVTAPMPEGATVSMLSSDIVSGTEVTIRRRVHTVAGFVDGGVWRNTLPIGGTQPELETMQVTVQVDNGCALPTNTVGLQVNIPCMSQRRMDPENPTVDIDVFTQCFHDRSDTYDVYVYAVDAGDFRLSAGTLLDQPWTAGRSTTHSVCPDDTDLLETILILEDLPSIHPGAIATLSGRRDGRRVTSDSYQSDEHVDPMVAAVRLPTDVFDTFDVSMVADIDALMGSSQGWFQIGQNGLTTLPKFLTHSIDDFARFDGAPRLQFSNLDQPDLSWELTDGALGTVVDLTGSWVDEDAAESTFWRAQVPADTQGSVVFPELPPALADFRPTLGATLHRVTGEHIGIDGIVDMGTYLQNPSHKNWFQMGASEAF